MTTILDLLKITELNKYDGIWLSGIEGEGEFRQWWKNCSYNRKEHSFWKNGVEEGEFKVWDSKGVLVLHLLYKKGKLIKDYINNENS